MGLLAYACACLGFIVLSLAMERHHGAVFRTRGIGRGRRRAFRWAGWSLLAASCVFCILGWGWIFGPPAWCLLLTAAALPVPLGLAYLPRAIALGGTPTGRGSRNVDTSAATAPTIGNARGAPRPPRDRPLSSTEDGESRHDPLPNGAARGRPVEHARRRGRA
jgi:hypothetical protein